MSTDPGREPLFAADIKMDDAWAIYDFLVPRLESLQRAHGDGTEERRTAEALAEAISVLVLEIEREIRGPMRPRLAKSSARPPAPAPAPTESERIAREKQRLTMIREYWNQLHAIVQVWRDSEGYDRVRWRQVGFLDAAAEAEYRRYVTEAGLRKAERP
ncbi:hypothetical protein [Streptomyces sp. MBT62]|uniref:hypothetical protein n=1 Tax=Streptomyces sp. MBT62 TaxID=2800410 RepID=UPI00190B49F8|nr:hypothetical protein [Streptomyces sp. MBT62]MBK3566854.1 hypothetical protein [Streptomyces sp. MBT62]